MGRMTPAQDDPQGPQQARGFARLLPSKPSVQVMPGRLARKMVLAFGFLAFIPLLLIFWAAISFILPNLKGAEQDTLRLVMLGIVGSICIGYFVLKRTQGGVLGVVQQVRQIKRASGVVSEDTAETDEIGELAKTFHRINQDLEQRVNELESSRALIKRLLSQIGTAMVSREGIDSLLELIVENTSTALEAQMGSLILATSSSTQLKGKIVWAANGRLVRERSMQVGEGIAGWVVKKGLPMRGVGSPEAVGLELAALPNGAVKEGAVLSVPLMSRERVLGALSMLREDLQRPFTEDDQLLLTNISSQMAVAIENDRLSLDIERTYYETIMALALAVEAKDPYSAGHCKRVGFYAVQIAQMLGLDEDTKQVLRDGGMLHDVGKIGVKDSILLKPGPLTTDERHIMQQHSRIGEAILKPVRSLQKVAQVVLCHHEHYDGTGYPAGLKGDDIPYTARILMVADCYDAMVTDRPYRKRMALDKVMETIRNDAGTHFDPAIVDAFEKIVAGRQQRMARTETPPHADTSSQSPAH